MHTLTQLLNEVLEICCRLPSTYTILSAASICPISDIKLYSVMATPRARAPYTCHTFIQYPYLVGRAVKPPPNRVCNSLEPFHKNEPSPSMKPAAQAKSRTVGDIVEMGVLHRTLLAHLRCRTITPTQPAANHESGYR